MEAVLAVACCSGGGVAVGMDTAVAATPVTADSPARAGIEAVFWTICAGTGSVVATAEASLPVTVDCSGAMVGRTGAPEEMIARLALSESHHLRSRSNMAASPFGPVAWIAHQCANHQNQRGTCSILHFRCCLDAIDRGFETEFC